MLSSDEEGRESGKDNPSYHDRDCANSWVEVAFYVYLDAGIEPSRFDETPVKNVNPGANLSIFFSSWLLEHITSEQR